MEFEKFFTRRFLIGYTDSLELLYAQSDNSHPSACNYYSKALKRVYYTRALWRFQPFLVSVCRCIRIYLVAYGPEIKGDFALEGKTEAVCGLGRTNYGGLRNVRPPIIDPL